MSLIITYQYCMKRGGSIKKCLVFDFDNTLFYNEKLMLPLNVIQEKKVCINTLRSPAGLLQKLGISCLSFPSIHFGGSLIYDTLNSKTLYYSKIEQNDFNFFEKQCDLKKITHRIIYLYNDAISSVNVTYHDKKNKSKEDIILNCIPIIEENIISESNVIAIYTKEKIKTFKFKIYKEGDYYIYISKKCNKGTALEKLKSFYNIDIIYSFGNSKNDYPMFDVSNYSYYVGKSKKYDSIKKEDIINIVKGIDIE